MTATATYDHLIADLDEFGYDYSVRRVSSGGGSNAFVVEVADVLDGGRDLVEKLLHLDVRVTPRGTEGVFLIRWNPTMTTRRALRGRDGRWETRNA